LRNEKLNDSLSFYFLCFTRVGVLNNYYYYSNYVPNTLRVISKERISFSIFNFEIKEEYKNFLSKNMNE